MERLSSKPFFVATLFIVLAICSYMNSSLAATPNQLSSEFFTKSPTTHDSQIKEKAFATDIITTSVALTISPTTGDSRINEKAFATKIITTSAPVTNSPTAHDTRINEKVSMASALTLLRRELLKGYSHPSAPSPDTYTNHKATPAPSPEFSLLCRKLLKGYTPPSAPSPDTYIPASASTLANHKTAPASAPN